MSGAGAATVTARAVERVALVGLPGVGKSSVARALARRRGWRLIDIDSALTESAGRSIPEVFAAEGETGFRGRELDALRAALSVPGPAVVACGGGIVTVAEARELLAAECTVVWLDGPDPLLLSRLGGAADRPLLAADPAARLAGLRAERGRLYGAVAHLRVDVGGGDIEDVTDRVEDAVSGVRLSVLHDAPAGEPERAPAAAAGHLGDAAVRVELGERSYPVHVGAGNAGLVSALLPPGARRVAVVSDRATLALARTVLASVRLDGRQGRIISVRGGERLKTWARAGRLVAALSRLRLERGDCVVAVGGGTVGDVAGFAAASYLRGIAVVHVPTTLLAMVDSAVGGKTGVNLPAGKNLAGAFWQPHAVLCDLDALRTLPRRPFRAAFAEIVKYAMILDAPALVTLLDTRLGGLLAGDADALATAVSACCALKAEVVGADEREVGWRAILNYGHTAGHALETVTGFASLLHGEAVAAGMRVAGRLSVSANGCPPGDVEWQDEMLARCSLGRVAGAGADAVLERTRGDKKATAGTARWVLLERRGRATPGHVVPDEAALAALVEVLGA